MENRTNALIYVIIIVLSIAFVFLYQKTTSLEFQLSQSSKILTKSEQDGQKEPTEEKSTTIESNTTIISSTTIPSAILFETKSSPILSPQSPIIVTIESVTLKQESIDVNIKAFTAKASSYTALEMTSLITELKNDGTIIKSLSTSTIWKSMPPKSFVTGTLSFSKNSQQKNIILRIDTGTEVTFYSFDLDKKTYKQVTPQ